MFVMLRRHFQFLNLFTQLRYHLPGIRRGLLCKNAMLLELSTSCRQGSGIL